MKPPPDSHTYRYQTRDISINDFRMLGTHEVKRSVLENSFEILHKTTVDKQLQSNGRPINTYLPPPEEDSLKIFSNEIFPKLRQ